jgi:hypothetical protein
MQATAAASTAAPSADKQPRLEATLASLNSAYLSEGKKKKRNRGYKTTQDIKKTRHP